MVHFLVERSVYHLKESDPHSFVLPRVDGPAKVALAEIQYDEYGAGRPERLHAKLYADALMAAGLDTGYAAYVDRVSAETSERAGRYRPPDEASAGGRATRRAVVICPTFCIGQWSANHTPAHRR